MKGLFVKDIELMKQQKQYFILVIVMGVILNLAGSGSVSFAIGYFTFVTAIFAITTISYDEFDNGLSLIHILYHVSPTAVQKNAMPSAATALAAKQTAMYIDGSWNHLDLMNSGCNWGVGVLPIDENYTTFFDGGSLIIFKSSMILLRKTSQLYSNSMAWKKALAIRIHTTIIRRK